ncbi:hypothetical protein RBG61_02980 [Paludicola sp. MB14-C6]|uniref:hypothetical protein n=1 Tax=Paludihabitans sp. MB14-C6 TaxID=3070656 RepID=UPI0027DB3EE0|nr:hypothetical protein [Paludicola sp. MB14-C6]WMJ23646.1 hypothetical protein RBG61_02980 [Paludicola sp. MB14-C6]
MKKIVISTIGVVLILMNFFYCFFRVKAHKVFITLTDNVIKENELLYEKYSNLHGALSFCVIWCMAFLVIMLSVLVFLNKLSKVKMISYLAIINLLCFISTIPFYFQIDEGYFSSLYHPLFIANLTILPLIIIVLSTKLLLDYVLKVRNKPAESINRI